MTATLDRAAHADKIDRIITKVAKYGAVFFLGWMTHSYVDRSADQAKAVLPVVIHQTACERDKALATNLVTPQQLDKDCGRIKVDPDLLKK